MAKVTMIEALPVHRHRYPSAPFKGKRERNTITHTHRHLENEKRQQDLMVTHSFRVALFFTVATKVGKKTPFEIKPDIINIGPISSAKVAIPVF